MNVKELKKHEPMTRDELRDMHLAFAHSWLTRPKERGSLEALGRLLATIDELEGKLSSIHDLSEPKPWFTKPARGKKK